MSVVKEMSYANYGIDVEDIDKLVRSALAGGRYRFARFHLQAYGYEFDDLRQQAMMYVWRNSSNYNAEAGAASTYIFQLVRSAVGHLMAYYERSGRRDGVYDTLSIDKPMFADGDGDAAEMLNYLGTEDFPEVACDLDYITAPLTQRFGAELTAIFVDVYAGDGAVAVHAKRIGMQRRALHHKLEMMRTHMRQLLLRTGDYAKCA